MTTPAPLPRISLVRQWFHTPAPLPRTITHARASAIVSAPGVDVEAHPTHGSDASQTRLAWCVRRARTRKVGHVVTVHDTLVYLYL